MLLTGCAQPAAQAGGGGGTIDAINHTKWAINHFSVNGQSGIDIIGPFQGGGGGCCFSVPARWTPGMTVRVDWE
ncbi:T6SS immunity phospholipase A1-binding lipoprotein Tli1-KP, partial [Klebsiella pneumoniae]|nr:T6SS immunity phospholipase A1-binding lipoprotein Tli1-KP [Klebsiella pneumoniae]MDL5472216.1 T6SS immunity phospholipase A1-binding lipoprotein Tli1-KP [Klebsiella pneumoniae]MDL5477576.1 T6SS immunity phospholipase A1-binding lipoprotein Tli1-KP [Klebsiella pneumoniae]MDV2575369.1 T6SS immunity phospholipase A1-binding lipoprotein Tli1-KP [Klebsiella pneumoniae]